MLLQYVVCSRGPSKRAIPPRPDCEAIGVRLGSTRRSVSVQGRGGVRLQIFGAIGGVGAVELADLNHGGWRPR